MTCDLKLTRQKQVLRKVESTCGTAESLTASEGGLLISVDSSFEPAEETNPRDIARSSLTSVGNIPGQKAGNFTVQCEINTPDSITPTALAMKPEFQGCGMTVQDVKTITIGAITSGPFTRNETITDVSGNTARLLVPAETGDSNLYLATISGSLQNAEVLTGSSSGATATSSSVYYNGGHFVKYQSNNQKSLTYKMQEDGFQWTTKGSMGNLTATMESSRVGIFEFAMQGVKSSYGDEALTTGIDYQEETPPVLQGAELQLNSQTVVFQSINLDSGNNVVPRIDGNEATTGLKSFYISGRDVKATLNYEHEDAADLDIFALLSAGTKVPLAWHVGTAAGKTVWFFGDYAQVTNIGTGDADGIRTIEAELTLTGQADASDDELEMVFI